MDLTNLKLKKKISQNITIKIKHRILKYFANHLQAFFVPLKANLCSELGDLYKDNDKKTEKIRELAVMAKALRWCLGMVTTA